MKTKMKWKIFILNLIFVLSLIIPVNSYSQNVGEAAPDFTLSLLGGGSFKLSNQSGKVVFIFLFGYACPHCLANGNNTETGIYDAYKSNPDFVAVGVDTWDGNSSGVQNFKSSTGLSYPLCLMGSAVLSSYNTTYDRIIVVDKQGTIRYKSTANSTSEVVTAAGSVVAELLSEDNTNPGDTATSPGDTTMNPGDTAMSPSAINTIDDINLLLKVYPVPARDKVLIESNLKSGEAVTISIFNTSGKMLNKKRVIINSNGKSPITISTENLSNGMYFLQFTTPSATHVRKLIVQRN